MNTYGFDLMGRRRRRRHTAEFKTAVIDECLRPAVSIAAVALAQGLNSNLLRKWVSGAEYRIIAPLPSAAPSPEPPSMPPPTFIPLVRPAPTVDGGQWTVDGEIRIELQRAGIVSGAGSAKRRRTPRRSLSVG